MSQRIQLGEVAEIQREGVDPSDVSAETRYVGLDAIESDGTISGSTTVGEAELASTKFRFSDKHILFGKLRPYLRKVARPSFEGICSTDIIPIAPSPRVDRDYLFHFLRTDNVINRATAMASGANLPRISPNLLVRFEVPLPPLDEQRRIAATLDLAATLVHKRQQADRCHYRLKRALFESMFGDPKTNHWKFNRYPLGELIKVSSGEGLTKDQQKGGPYPVYGGNGINGYHDSFSVTAGTIVIGRVGVYCGAIHVTSKNAWVTDNALVVTIRTQHVTTEYLATALELSNLNQYAGRSAQPLISGGRIYPVEILVPPLEDQRRFNALVAKIDLLSSIRDQRREKVAKLFIGLQDRAFEGAVKACMAS